MSVKPTIRSRDLAALVRLHRIRERLRALRHAPELEHPGCKQRAQTDCLAHTTAANQSSAARRKNSEGVKAAWARRRAQEVRP
jgi:hypothetical protein